MILCEWNLENVRIIEGCTSFENYLLIVVAKQLNRKFTVKVEEERSGRMYGGGRAKLKLNSMRAWSFFSNVLIDVFLEEGRWVTFHREFCNSASYKLIRRNEVRIRKGGRNGRNSDKSTSLICRERENETKDRRWWWSTLLEETFSRDFLSKCKSTSPPLSPYPLPSSRNLQKSKKTIDHHPPPFPKDIRFPPDRFHRNRIQTFLISNVENYQIFSRDQSGRIRSNSIGSEYTIQKRIRNGITAWLVVCKIGGAVERLI